MHMVVLEQFGNPKELRNVVGLYYHIPKGRYPFRQHQELLRHLEKIEW